jgi:serine/threonine protein kinase
MSMIGKSLVHYEITAEIGKGGMGEVYQAKDTKLGRDVAIKVLPEEFALDTDRVARFQREAKLLASLNHPNIAAIYGLEESEGTHFLVMELIEGDTLRDRIKSGPIPVEEALKLALQMAEALEAAHEKGVIHRDLKPANIKVTPDGKVKILDFGLAKAYVGDQENMSPMDSPTISAAATQQGVILGTAAYMSPEQARGKPVDKRADIWAFGCVLFEMLTGQAAFQGEDVTEVLAAVVKSEVNLDLLPDNIHPRVRELLSRSLLKDQKKRYGGIGEAQYEIEQVLSDPSGVLVQPVTQVKPKKKLRVGIPWVAAITILGITFAGVAVWYLKPSTPTQVMRFDYELPQDQQFSSLEYPSIAISPNGKHIVYSTPEGLCLRSTDELTAKLIAGTEGSTSQPFFSPDGKWIGYFSVGDVKMKKIDINGGAPVTLCDKAPYGANWATDSTIIFGQLSGNIMRISSSGGVPESLAEMKNMVVLFPQMLPDEKTVMFTTMPPRRIIVQSLESGEQKELFAGYGGRYISTGHIVYGLENNNNLFAVPFDLNKLEVTGGAVPIVEGAISPLQCAFSDSGTLVYIPGGVSGVQSNRYTLVWVDRSGNEETISAPPRDYIHPRISPDGNSVAFSLGTGENRDIWIWDFVREIMTRLTINESNENTPLWTPDGQQIVFASDREGMDDVYLQRADGTNNVERLVSEPVISIWPQSWSSDGKTLITSDWNAQGGLNIGALLIDGDRERTFLLQEDYAETQPRVSPDGRWMAYVSSESGESHIYIRPFPDLNQGKKQVSASAGKSPLWSPDSRELFYRGIGPDAGAVLAVSLESEPTLKLGNPKILFRGSYAMNTNLGGVYYWDIHPNGKKFLMIKPPGTPDDESVTDNPRKINIVLNWLEELKQRVPVD